MMTPTEKSDKSVEEPGRPKVGKGSKNVLVEGLRYAHLGLVLPVSVIIGWWFGSLLDGWMGTKWINIAGLIFGIFAGFYELIRTIMRMSKKL